MGFVARPAATIRLLLVDADPAARQILRAGLEARIARPLALLETADPATARAMVGERSFEVIVADLATVGGADAFAQLAARAAPATTYAMGEGRDVQAAVACIRAGAADFLEKPLDGAAFARRIERQFASASAAFIETFEGLVGQSQPMLALFDQIRRIAPSPAPVLVTGPAGSGKSLVARAIHARSRRREGPFVVLDCAAETEAALMAELFEAGGAAARAEGGTLVLDGIDALSEPGQAALARLLDMLSPPGRLAGGGSAHGEAARAPIRVIALSRRPLEELGHADGMRRDLFFRLAVLPLEVPPFSARRDDLPALIETLLREINRQSGARSTRLSAAAAERLAAGEWPGNGHALRQALAKLAAAHAGDLVPGEAVTAFLAAEGNEAALRGRSAADVRPLWMEEARIIEEAVAAFGGNIARAAAALEISPSTIYRKRRGGAEARGREVA